MSSTATLSTENANTNQPSCHETVSCRLWHRTRGWLADGHELLTPGKVPSTIRCQICNLRGGVDIDSCCQIGDHDGRRGVSPIYCIGEPRGLGTVVVHNSGCVEQRPNSILNADIPRPTCIRIVLRDKPPRHEVPIKGR